MLDHQKLRVYYRALELLDTVDTIVGEVKCRAHLKDQLDRAATSVVLNIAEGAGEFVLAEKRRFYRMARRSTCETAAILEILRRRNAVRVDLLDAGHEHATAVIATLVSLIKKGDGQGQVHGNGHGT